MFGGTFMLLHGLSIAAYASSVASSEKVQAPTPAPRSLDLTRNLISQSTHQYAKCLDGTAPVYYYRDGVGTRKKSLVIFLEGGGWCYPSDIQQACSPQSSYVLQL